MNNVKEHGVLGPIEGKSVWFSRLIAAGLGSSAYYPAEALEASGREAFPVGTHIHSDHQSWREWDEHPANEVKTIIGVISSEPKYLRAGETVELAEGPYTADVDGLYAHTEYVAEWAPFVEQVGKYLGLSISAQVKVRSEEHSSGLPILESFIPSPVNTVDLVTAPGANGRVIAAVESAKASGTFVSEKDGIIQTDSRKSREDQGMTPEEIKAVAEALSEAIVPALKEAVKPEEVEAPEVSISDVAEAIVTADLPQAARQKVYAAVEAGAVLSEAIEAEKQYIKGITESMNVQEGVLHEGSKKEPVDYTIAGW